MFWKRVASNSLYFTGRKCLRRAMCQGLSSASSGCCSGAGCAGCGCFLGYGSGCFGCGYGCLGCLWVVVVVVVAVLVVLGCGFVVVVALAARALLAATCKVKTIKGSKPSIPEALGGRRGSRSEVNC